MKRAVTYWPVSEELLRVLIEDGCGESVRHYLERYMPDWIPEDVDETLSESARTLVLSSGLSLARSESRYVWDEDLGMWLGHGC